MSKEELEDLVVLLAQRIVRLEREIASMQSQLAAMRMKDRSYAA